MIKGKITDISHYQKFNSMQSYQELKDSGVICVIHKCTQSSGMLDATYQGHIKGLKEVGIPYLGAYHYLTCRNLNGTDEAQFFMDTVDVENNPDIKLALDFEEMNYSTCNIKNAELFVQAVFERAGKYPLLYTGRNKISDGNLDVDSVLLNCPLWWAQYSNQISHVPKLFKNGVSIWQYSGTGRLPGLDGICDMDALVSDDINDIAILWDIEAQEAKPEGEK